jgi:hypothetical protein
MEMYMSAGAKPKQNIRKYKNIGFAQKTMEKNRPLRGALNFFQCNEKKIMNRVLAPNNWFFGKTSEIFLKFWSVPRRT